MEMVHALTHSHFPLEAIIPIFGALDTFSGRCTTQQPTRRGVLQVAVRVVAEILGMFETLGMQSAPKNETST